MFMLLLMFMSFLYNTGSNSVIQEVDICDRDSVINLHVDGVEVFVRDCVGPPAAYIIYSYVCIW